MSRSWLRVLAIMFVVVLGPGCLAGARSTGAVVVNDRAPVYASDTIVHVKNGIAADAAVAEVSVVFPGDGARISKFADRLNASASAVTTCRCESHMRPVSDSDGRDGDAVMLTGDDGNDGDEYALPGSLAGVGSYLGAASDLAAWPEQLPESPIPAPPEYPPAA